MKKKLRLALIAVLTATLAVSAVMIVRQQLQYRESALSYQNASQYARFEPNKSPVPSPGQSAEDGDSLLDSLSRLDLAALQERNPDVVGWIYVPDTELSYPLLCGTDNQFYLNHTWDRVRNGGGSIFLDYRCASDFTSPNTVIYGHRMNNTSMFGTLKYYKNVDYWREHPTIYLQDSAGTHIYDIFAAWEPSVTSAVYTMDFASVESWQEFLDICLAGNQLDTGITPKPGDRLLTLSTCTSNGHATRWVVQAVERKTEET